MGVRVMFLAGVLGLAGCGGSGQPACFSVKGRVLFEKAPIAEAQVALHPVGQTLTVKPVGVTDGQGYFTLSTFGTNDGAPPGRYIVTVTWKQLIQTGEEKTRSGRNQLPAHYGDPRQSTIRCEIKPSANELPTFELKR
jgi:hypothetical protein